MNDTKETQSEAEDRRRAACDVIVQRAATLMIEEAGASTEMMVDRLLTYAGAAAALTNGSPATANIFRGLADNIDAGCFHPVTGEQSSRKHGQH